MSTHISVKHRYAFVFILLTISLFTASCSLKRNNPLDPMGNPNVVAPDPVMNPTASSSPAHATVKSVTLSWDPNSSENTSGYYIYRGLNYYSAYTLVGTVDTPEVIADKITYIHTGPTVQPGNYYWYKVSAYKTYPTGNLEGSRTDVAPVYVLD